MNTYQNKKIAVIGLGKTGLSCVHFLRNKKARVRVMDTRLHPAGADSLPPSFAYGRVKSTMAIGKRHDCRQSGRGVKNA